MNAQSKFKKINWANGWPAVDVDPYDYSMEGFNRMVSVLAKEYGIAAPPVIMGLDVFASDVEIKNQVVYLHMDNYFCSVACESGDLRDEFFDLFTNSR